MIFASSIEVNIDQRGAHGHGSFYSLTKSIGELLSQHYCAEYGITVVVARLPGIYGAAYDYPDKVPNIFIKQALEGELISIPSQSREMHYVHIDDMCVFMAETIEQVFNFQSPSYSLVEIKSCETVTLVQLVSQILTLTGSESSVHNFVEGQAPSLQVSEILVKSPRIGLQEGLLRLAEEMKDTD